MQTWNLSSNKDQETTQGSRQLEESMSMFHLGGAFFRTKFAYGEVKNPLKLYRGKDCIRKFCNHVIGEARHLYHSFPESLCELYEGTVEGL